MVPCQMLMAAYRDVASNNRQASLILPVAPIFSSLTGTREIPSCADIERTPRISFAANAKRIPTAFLKQLTI